MTFLWWMRGPLCDQAGADGAGAGGGSGDGAGAGKDKSGGFDAAAFQTSLMAEVNKTINGAVKGLKTEIAKLAGGNGKGGGSGDGSGDGAGGGDGSGDGAGAGSGSGSGDKNKPDANTRQLESRLKTLETTLETERKTLQEERNARRNAERDSTVQRVLSGFQFADEEAGRDAFDLVAPKLKWADDGTLVGPDGETSAEDWVKSVMAKKTHLLAPKDTGGAGARGGKNAAGGTRKWDLTKDLDPANFAKLSTAEQAELRAHVAQVNGI